MNDIKQIVTPGIREEAGIIALMMREQLQTPGKTAALVTPDRMLARQVSGELRRWDIDIDDSAGTPLFNTAPGIYLRLLAEMVSEKMSPVSLMSAMKHPLMAGGWNVGDFRSKVRNFEHSCLRGVRPAPGLMGIDLLLKHESSVDDELTNWWIEFRDIIAPFDELFERDNVSFAEMLLAHVEMAEKLAATDKMPGDKLLWRGDAGEEAAKLMNRSY